jgi:hypothetical protein
MRLSWGKLALERNDDCTGLATVISGALVSDYNGSHSINVPSAPSRLARLHNNKKASIHSFRLHLGFSH